jgi:UDP-N-acetylmuramoyl-L-alanyl-D-glutamate--2,6-diaminopimelate ligase
VQTPWGVETLQSPLYGSFNLSNLLATIAVAGHCGLSLPAVVTQLATVPAVAGRMERFGQQVIVDYAHTPDALEKTLLALREHCNGQLWCLFGCGGNRDRGKRPLMGAIAQQYADKVVITDDNPRNEESSEIIQDILQGCPQPTAIIPQREQAIFYALQHAQSEDMILIAGKGHEDYQQIKDQRLPFSDRKIVADLLKIG